MTYSIRLKQLIIATATLWAFSFGCGPGCSNNGNTGTNNGTNGTTNADTNGVQSLDPPHAPFVAFDAGAGLSTQQGDVTQWEGLGGVTLTAVDGGATLDESDGEPSLSFDGTGYYEADLGQSFGDATILARFRYSADSSDNDYVYSLGKLTLSEAGATMTLSRGEFDSDGAFVKAYHFNGSDDLYGEEITGEVWHTSAQRYYGTDQNDGNHHEMRLDGDPIDFDTADTPYSTAGRLVVGNWQEPGYEFVGRIRSILIYDRVLSDDEIADAEAWLAGR